MPNHPLELNHAVPGGRVELFAIRAGEDTEIEFHGIVTYVARFLTEVDELAENDTDTEDTNP